MSKINIRLYFFFILTGFLLSSCSNSSTIHKSPSFGNIGQIMVVADDNLWNGSVGDTFLYHFESPYLILPQPEPIFDVSHYDPMNLTSIRKELHTIVLIGNLKDGSSSTTALIRKLIGEDEFQRANNDSNFKSAVLTNLWAKNQTIYLLFAQSDEALKGIIKNSFPIIADKIHKQSKYKIHARSFVTGVNEKLKLTIKDSLHFNIDIPGDYKLALEEKNMMWLRQDNSIATSNILLYSEPYKDKSQLSKEHLKAIRDSLGKKYIATSFEGSYMLINDVDLPTFYNVMTIDGNYAIEARGIWEMENDFMGGAFVSYIIHDSKRQNIVFVDGFIHAPGQTKRKYMQDLTLILNTVKF